MPGEAEGSKAISALYKAQVHYELLRFDLLWVSLSFLTAANLL